MIKQRITCCDGDYDIEERETHGHNFYDSKNPLVRRYANKMMESVSSMIFDSLDELVIKGYFKWKPKVRILDFGCGTKKLKDTWVTKLKHVEYIGYDNDRRYTEIKDYKKVNPDIIVFSHVLEHLTPMELENLFKWVKKTKCKYIVTALPTENWIAKAGDLLFWKGRSHIGHNTKSEKIRKSMKKHFKLLKTESIMTMSLVELWRVK